jgi:hypothetical protein
MKQLIASIMLMTAATLCGCDSADDVQREIPGPSTRPDQPDSG